MRAGDSGAASIQRRAVLLMGDASSSRMSKMYIDEGGSKVWLPVKSTSSHAWTVCSKLDDATRPAIRDVLVTHSAWPLAPAAGEAHLVHRDLAARNVLVDSLYNFRIADFGLARNTNTNALDTDGHYYRCVLTLHCLPPDCHPTVRDPRCALDPIHGYPATVRTILLVALAAKVTCCP